MRFPTICLIIICLVSSELGFTAAQKNFDCYNCEHSHGNYTSTSAYSRNLRTLLNTMASDTQSANGFYNLSLGQDSDKVYVTGLCRADVSVSDCRGCISEAAELLPRLCPTQKQAIGLSYNLCIITYSDSSLQGSSLNSPNCTMQQNRQDISDPEMQKFKQTLATLFEGLKHNASAGGTSLKFAIGSAKVTASIKAYALTQCNPDLSPSDCSGCLQAGFNQLQGCCGNLSGAKIYGPICIVEFANYPILYVSRTLVPPTTSMDGGIKSGKRKASYKVWILIVVLVLLFMVLAILVFCWTRRRMRKTQNDAESNNQIRYVDYMQFDLSIVKVATDNFSDSNSLGRGSSSTVYKGTLPNGQEIAVKRFCQNGRDDADAEFNDLVLLTANLQHKNLVKLLGFCLVKDQRLLINEFLPNESLDCFIKDPVKRASLDWETRNKIILGIARGLLYLHEDSQLRLIHRDLKPCNILLDAQMNPKISNFSKASLVQGDQARGNTNTIVGTYGYMPPEYVHQGHFSIKSDVFSFGVLLLEIISGQMINCFLDGEKGKSLLSFAWKKWSEGAALDVMDQTLPKIQNQIPLIMRCIRIGLLCVQEDPACRPTMSTVVFMLNSDIVDIAEPLTPATVILSNMDPASSSYTNSDESFSRGSSNEASISTLE